MLYLNELLGETRVRVTGATPVIDDLEQVKHYENNNQNHSSEDNSKELLDSADKLASKIRHDIRSPLSAIKNAVYFIRKNPKMTEQMLDSIDKSVDKALLLLEELKPLTRDIAPNLVPVCFSRLLDDTLSEVQLPPNIIVNKEVEEVNVFVDPDMMIRVLDNLISNSIQAMPDGGTLSFNVCQSQDCLIIRITDTGKGIPSESQDKIFKPFYTTKLGNVGLGLSFVKRAVEAHNGTIQITSTLDVGTDMLIKIPVN
jgi:signal transduction histidine kinase